MRAVALANASSFTDSSPNECAQDHRTQITKAVQGNMSFIAQALAQLRWIDSEIQGKSGSERGALESARTELLQLILLAVESAELASPKLQ